MSENSGPAGQGHSKNKATVPAKAKQAQALETKQQAAVEKKYTAPAKNKGEGSQAASDKAKSDALEAAQKIPVRDAHDKPKAKITPPTPKPPPPSPPPVKVKKSGTNTNTVTVTGGEEDNSGDTSNPVMEPTPTPDTTTTIEPETVRTPTRNVTDISSLVQQFNAEQIQKLHFENLSAIDLSKVERHDTIEGLYQKYSIISNLSEIRKKYDMSKQLTIMDKFKPLTSIYTINIQDKIPQEDYILLESLDSTYQYLDENNQIITREKGYYYIDTNGDLVIELINLERNQQVEVLIDTNGTIYKIEKVES
jgi:hypothetical protein